MRKGYELLAQARMDLIEITHYISRDNPAAARKLRSLLMEACAMIAEHPHMGQSREDLSEKPVRFWPVHRNYMIIYNPNITPVHILRIYNSARDVGVLFTR